MSAGAPQPAPASPAAEGNHIPRWVVLLFAVACGATVANLYYAQPLLDVIATSLHVSSTSAVLIVTASQIGYAAGLLFLVPLGDRLDRRRMIQRMLGAATLALVGAALAPSLVVLALALAVAGVMSVVAQILIPLASTLAAEDERGRVLGVVMSGLLLGILLARTVSGFVDDLAGWRAIFWVGAAVMALLTIALSRAVPSGRGASTLPYGRLLLSVGALVRDEPLLRRRMLFGACGMASFTVLWTSLALLLSDPPFDYGEATIGLFGLAGVAGAGAAQIAGRLADAGHVRAATGAFLVTIVAGWIALDLGHSSVALILVGVVLLDLGVQGQHILNQSTIYTLAPETRSRITTAYMTGNFVSAALASAATAGAWHIGGWDAVCAFGGAISLLALAAWALFPRPGG